MNYFLVCPIGVIGGQHGLLTYSSIDSLEIGQMVKIPFGRRIVRGVVIQSTVQPKFATKSIDQKLPEILPAKLVELAQWISQYYAVRLPVVLQTIAPSGTGIKRREQSTNILNGLSSRDKSHSLNQVQQAAVQTIENSKSITHLLHGVTGSGKTEVYKTLAKKVLFEQRSVVILVPEIALTPQLTNEFSSLSQNIVTLHSKLTEAQRHLIWQKLNDSSEPWVVVGPRSALFTPLKDIGLIVIDECHEPSYQQDSQPKYNALRVGRKLAELHNAKLILGSATPLISDYYLAKKTDTPIIELPNSINTIKPTVRIVDLRDRSVFGSHQIFSKQLIAQLKSTLGAGRQSMIFHNRRGSARMGLCNQCGWVAECPNCQLPLRLHHDDHQLRCHLCGLNQTMPTCCPECQNPEIIFKGFGSKRLEQEVKRLFPKANVARFDSDNVKGEMLHERYQELHDGSIDIIIGTQSIAKGLDLPKLDLVGVIQADTELYIPDFSSSERSFQLTNQVIGRVGRAGQSSNVIIQTYSPDHLAIHAASQHDYGLFYQKEIKERELEHVMPFTFMLQLATGYASEKSATLAAEKLKLDIKKRFPAVNLRGPAPAFHEHRGNKYYQQLVVTSSKRSELTKIAASLPARWQFTLDPLNLL